MHSLGARIEVMDEEMATTLRQKTGAERLEIASRMFGSARRMLLSHLHAVHPDCPMEQSELLRFVVSVLERLNLP